LFYEVFGFKVSSLKTVDWFQVSGFKFQVAPGFLHFALSSLLPKAFGVWSWI